MPSGYCSACRCLVPITPGEHRGDSRQRVWRPAPHRRPDGAPCDGTEREAGDVEFVAEQVDDGKIRIDLSDPGTRATWEAAKRAAAEVAAWPPWKRGEG
jgi:hypothetical protein